MKIKWPKKFYRMTAATYLGGHHGDDVQDMLRYDFAFQNTTDPSIVAFPLVGGFGGKPTMGRWESFGIKLVPVDANTLEDGYEARYDRWVTYRRAHNASMPGDDLAPRKLAEFAQAKNLYEM